MKSMAGAQVVMKERSSFYRLRKRSKSAMRELQGFGVIALALLLFVLMCRMPRALAQPLTELKEAAPAEAEQTSSLPVSSSADAVLSPDCVRAGELMAQGVKLADGSQEEEQLYRQALGVCPVMAEAQHNLGLVLFKQGRNEEAEQALRRALELKEDLVFKTALATVHLALDRIEEARRGFEGILKEAPRDVKALQGLSVVLDRAGQSYEALETLKQARAIDDGSALTHYNLAAIYDRLGQMEAAIGSYQKAVQVDARYFDANFYLGLALEKSGRFSEAQAALRRAVELKPDHADCQNALARAYGRTADWDKSELALRRALVLNQADLPTQVNLAIVLMKKKQPPLAKEFIDKALSLEPKSAEALGVSGWVELELGNYSQAERQFLSSLDLDAANATVQHALGVLYQRQGRKEEAEQRFNAAAGLDPALQEHRRIDWRFWQ